MNADAYPRQAVVSHTAAAIVFIILCHMMLSFDCRAGMKHKSHTLAACAADGWSRGAADSLLKNVG